MSFSLAPICNGWQAFGTTGLPLNAGQLFTYQAGTTTPAATYTTSVGNVPNANPIILGADGRPPQEIWLQDGLSYKFVLMDSLSNQIATYDNIQSIGTLIQNFVTSTAFLTQADGRYPIYVGTAGGSSDALTATVATSITALYNGMVVSLDAIAANSTATPTFTLTLGSTITSTLTIVDYNLQPLQAGAIAGVGHKIFLGYNSIQGKWILMNPQPSVASSGTVSRRQTALIGPVDVSGFPSFFPQTVTGLTLTTQNITGTETVQTSTVTFSAANPTTATWVGHTLVVNQAISFTTTVALPGGLSAGTVYYVINTATNTFQVAATPGGAAIGNGAGSGVQTGFAGVQLPLTGTAYFGNDGVTGELNIVGQATANFSFPTLTNNATNILYSTISSLGIFTHFSTTLAPVIGYGVITAPSTTAGQITIDTVRCEVYLGNGSTAPETNLVIWGTATTSGGNITATQVYNYGKPQTFNTKKSGTFLKRTVYATPGTFTWIKSAQTTSINAKVKGGGGAGGTGIVCNTYTTQAAGGGEGGYAEGFFDASLFNTQTVTIGAIGGSCSVGSLISATAGAAGANATTAASIGAGVGGFGGTLGGAGTGGDVQLNGQAGFAGGFSNTTTGGLAGGNGGGIGGGAGGAGSGNGAGSPGTAGSSGAGGGGGGNASVTSGGGGGAASAGYVIIEEYA